MVKFQDYQKYRKLEWKTTIKIDWNPSRSTGTGYSFITW